MVEQRTDLMFKVNSNKEKKFMQHIYYWNNYRYICLGPQQEYDIIGR